MCRVDAACAVPHVFTFEGNGSSTPFVNESDCNRIGDLGKGFQERIAIYIPCGSDAPEIVTGLVVAIYCSSPKDGAYVYIVRYVLA
jgi:hypothetical protein